MDPKFRSSFIPKKPISGKPEMGRVRRRKKSFDIFTLGSIIIFFIALIAAGTTYGYAYVLQDQVDQKGEELVKKIELINLEQIEDFKLLDNRLNVAWRLLRDHKITSRFFELLEENTLHTISFDSYTFERESGDALYAIELSGEAESFDALALQADVLRRQTLIKSVELFNLDSITSKEGLILFTIEAMFDPKEIAYIIETETE